MKKLFNLAAFAFTMAAIVAIPLHAHDGPHDGVTPDDVKQGAEDKRQTIEKNTREAGQKAKKGAFPGSGKRLFICGKESAKLPA